MRMHEAARPSGATDERAFERRETGRESKTQTAQARNDTTVVKRVNRFVGNGNSDSRVHDGIAPARGCLFGLVFSVALVAIIVGACYLVSFLLSNPPLAAVFIAVASLLVVVTLTRADA